PAMPMSFSKSPTRKNRREPSRRQARHHPAPGERSARRAGREPPAQRPQAIASGLWLSLHADRRRRLGRRRYGREGVWFYSGTHGKPLDGPNPIGGTVNTPSTQSDAMPANIRRRGPSPRGQAIIQLRQAGMKQTSIAARLGVSLGSVKQAL